jgi:hypothetical protein
MTSPTYGAEHDAVVKTMQLYIDGCKHGQSKLMRPAFHANAGFFGYVGEDLAVGTSFLFEWVDKNGPSPRISEVFTLLKRHGEWKITQKTFHWHER